MAEQTGYEIEGNVVSSLGELANLLGVEKVTSKDVKSGGQYADIVSIIQFEGKDEEEDKEVYTALLPEDMENLGSVDQEEIVSSLPEFENVDEVKEFIKDIDTRTLEYLATGLGLEWKPTYHANIHRMRIAMELQRHFFPENFKPKSEKKKKAKYGDFSTEQLYELLNENKLEFKSTGNDHIDRMKAITTLKKAGVLVE